MTPPPVAPTPDLDLPTTLRALAGDGEAIASLYGRHHPQVLRIAHRIVDRLRPLEDATELAQEVWLRLLAHGCRPLRAFDPARGSFEGFLKMVAWQQAFAIAHGWVRRQERERLDPCPWPPEPWHPPEADALDRRQLLGFLVRDVSPWLTTLDRILLAEVHLRQTTIRELAPRLGCTTASLYKRNRRLHRLLGRAARRLDAERLSSTPRGPGTRSRPASIAPTSAAPAGAGRAPAR